MLLNNYLHKIEQNVVLNGQKSESRIIYFGVLQGSVLGTLLFLIYINNLPNGITSMFKIFPDKTFLSSQNLNVNTSVVDSSAYVEKINQWPYEWKMQHNPAHNKQANKVISSQKSILHSLSHPPIKFNEIIISKCNHQNNLETILDSNLDFDTHIDQIFLSYHFYSTQRL